MRFETLAVHAGAERDPSTGAVAPPLHLSTTFEHGPAGERPHGLIYVRDGNPTQSRLEEALAALEGGEAALVYGSGMAAAAALLQALPPGGHVILHGDVYYSVRTIAGEFLPRWGLTASSANLADLDAARAALRPNTSVLWVETPSNPLLQVADLAALADVAHAAGARLVVDGTFATPALQQPLALGADVVMHSMTKYLGGHSDVQGGALVFPRRDALFERAEHVRHVLGAVASPFVSWLVLRGLRTLPCRMDRHSANAMAVARALARHPAVASVHYPGLETHPGHAIARAQMRAFGGMLSIRVRGGREGAVRATSRVRLFLNATSLGGPESLLEHRASVESANSTVPDDLIRLSVGLEHADDLVADLESAFG